MVELVCSGHRGGDSNSGNVYVCVHALVGVSISILVMDKDNACCDGGGGGGGDDVYGYRGTVRV